MQDVDAVDVSESGLSLAELDDAELLRMARLDNTEAYAALFTRYTYAAHRLARHLGQREEAEDVVAESFTRVLDLVRRGKGPEQAFRAYLFTTIRHESARRGQARRRVVPTADERQIDSVAPFGNDQLDEFEKSAIRAAYESLPRRWRTVLWHLDVEGRKPHELGPLLDLSPNSVSALVYRARSGLREAYLQQHVKAEPATERSCREIRAKLSAFVRRTATGREQEKIHAHLETCIACMTIHLDLQEVNREVGSIIAPAALAIAVTGAVEAVGVGTLATFVAHLAVAGKGLLVALAPPAAAAAITTATVAGMSAPQVVDPPRTSLAAHSPADPAPRLGTTRPHGARLSAAGAAGTTTADAASIPATPPPSGSKRPVPAADPRPAAHEQVEHNQGPGAEVPDVDGVGDTVRVADEPARPEDPRKPREGLRTLLPEQDGDSLQPVRGLLSAPLEPTRHRHRHRHGDGRHGPGVPKSSQDPVTIWLPDALLGDTN